MQPVPPDDLLTVRVVRTGEQALLLLTGELDVSTVELLDAVVGPLLAGTDPAVRQVLVDCAELSFVDVAGLGALLAARQTLRQRSGALLLRSASPALRRVLSLAGLEGLLADDPLPSQPFPSQPPPPQPPPPRPGAADREGEHP